MMIKKLPSLPLPPPLRGAEIGTFAYNTVAVRLPDIARRTLVENDFPPEVMTNVKTLIEEIANGRIRPLSDSNDWDAYTAEHLGSTWLDVPWFFAETYFYRRLLAATGYFDNRPTAGVDPFALQKQQGLKTTMPATRALAAQLNTWLDQGWQESTFASLLAIDLWGNQADLSLWPTDAGEKPDHADSASQQEHLLTDDTTAVTHYLTTRLLDNTTTRLDFIIDNAGFELVCDLCLADYFLSTLASSTVHFHLKIHPTFVSDALIQDVQETISFLQSNGDHQVQLLGIRLAEHVANGRFQLRSHPYWTSPLPGWEIPSGLHADLASASLIISKGDANYRRWMGDRHWGFITPFPEIVSYLPAPLAALRTLKSEIVVGLAPGQAASLDQKDPNWLTNGRWGLIQLANPEGLVS